MKIYTYNENCTRKGTVIVVLDGDDDEFENNGDVSLYADADKETIITDALKSLATRYDHRAGGAGDAFRWKCDRNVIDVLGGPEVKFDAKTMTYLPADEVVEDDDEEGDE